MNKQVFRLLLGFMVSCTACMMGDDACAQGTPAWTPAEEELHRALQGAEPVRIRELLAAGANVNARNVLGGNALHVAANYRGDVEVMRMILDKGADVNAVNGDGHTPLLLALRHGHYRHEGKGERLLAVAGLLLSRGASAKIAGASGELPVSAAMDPPNLPLIRLLIQHGAALPADGLHWALGADDVELVKLMMTVATPATLAYKDTGGGSMLHRAAEKPRMVFVMQWLLGKGADVNALDHSLVAPFGTAALYDNVPGMAFLQNAKADMTRVSAEGQTALHLAAYGSRHETLRWLLERGGRLFDLKARDKRGRSALDIAIDTHRYAYYTDARKLELVSLLGGTPADVARGRHSNHPLHEAVNSHDIRAVERLLESGVSPNVKNESGHTPLFWAIAYSSGLPATPGERAFGAKLLPLLIRYGADTQMPSGNALETYDDYARGLRIGDLLERTKQRYAPRGR
jgi:ankyrin repeat protein